MTSETSSRSESSDQPTRSSLLAGSMSVEPRVKQRSSKHYASPPSVGATSSIRSPCSSACSMSTMRCRTACFATLASNQRCCDEQHATSPDSDAHVRAHAVGLK